MGNPHCGQGATGGDSGFPSRRTSSFVMSSSIVTGLVGVNTSMPELKLGAHLSLGRSPRLALRDARDHGVGSAQIFTSSPAAWKPPVMTPDGAGEMRDARETLGIEPLFIHAIYLINLASEDPTLVARSRSSLSATLQAGALLGARGVITHIGSHGGRGFDAVAEQVAEALKGVLADIPTGISLILENSAGSGGIIGSSLEELAALLDLANNPDHLEVALDTAHLCAAGWDFREPGTAHRLVSEVEAEIGLHRLAALHANDSRAACGRRVDRHANVGEGHIGIEGFRSLLAEPALRRVPWLLETPDLGSPDDPFRSVATLRELAAEAPAGVR